MLFTIGYHVVSVKQHFFVLVVSAFNEHIQNQESKFLKSDSLETNAPEINTAFPPIDSLVLNDKGGFGELKVTSTSILLTIN
jgi:hypothetical protein